MACPSPRLVRKCCVSAEAQCGKAETTLVSTNFTTKAWVSAFMHVAGQIELHVHVVAAYYHQLVVYADSALAKRIAPELTQRGTSPTFLPVGLSHLVRQDMACNIYSLADFWLADLCRRYQQRG